MNDSPVILEIKNADVRRAGARVLDVSNLSLRAGEVLCVVGPNGSGKSTLLLTLCSLLKRAQGLLLFKGAPVDGRTSTLAYRRHTGTVFQEPLLFDRTVYDNVASGLKLRGMGRRDIRQQVEHALERFRIAHLARRSARKLSGGEAQRTALARAFATDPEILFLDEPFSALDPPTREALIDDLERIFHDTGISVVMSSHDQTEALRIADSMAVMRQGSIVQMGPPEQIINFPADEFVASFVGMGTVLKGRVVEALHDTVKVDIAGRIIECVGATAAGSQVILCIRPEHVTLALRSDSDSARNHFAGRITRIISKGHFLKIQLDCGFPLTTHITHQSCDELNLVEGGMIAATFKATAVHMIAHSD